MVAGYEPAASLLGTVGHLRHLTHVRVVCWCARWGNVLPVVSVCALVAVACDEACGMLCRWLGPKGAWDAKGGRGAITCLAVRHQKGGGGGERVL